MFLPWIDHGQVRSKRYWGTGFRIDLGVFTLSFLGLGAVGAGITTQFMEAWFPGADVTAWENAFGRLMTGGYRASSAFSGSTPISAWKKPARAHARWSALMNSRASP